MPKIVKNRSATSVIWADPRDLGYEEAIDYCAKILKRGGLVAFPTETVYGIAAKVFDKNAVRRLCRVKNRPRGKPFTVHIAKIGDIKKMGCVLNQKAKILASRYWPGPLTMILMSREMKKVGFRMPANKIAMDLIKRAGTPVYAPSANISGGRPPTCAAEVLKSFAGEIDVILNGGRTEMGIESTVIDLTVDPPKVLREGAIKEAELTFTQV